MVDDRQRLRKVAAQVNHWFNSKPASFWVERRRPIFRVFVEFAGALLFLDRAIASVGFHDVEDDAALTKNMMEDLTAMLNFEEESTSGPARSLYYLASAVVSLTAVIEILSQANYGDERSMFAELSLRNLRKVRNVFAHLSTIYDDEIELPDVVSLVEKMLPEFKTYLQQHGFVL